MSNESSRVTAEHFAYVAARTTPEDDFLRDLKAAAREAGIPPINIAPEQASFMQILLKAIQAKVVIEVGTLAGYSAIAMARALPDGGRVETVELLEKHAQFAQAWADKPESGVAGKVAVHQGGGMDVLPTFGDDTADAAFLDADKSSYADYLVECRRIVRPGGLLLCDNAFAFGQLLDDTPTDPEVGAVRAFNDHMAAQTGLQGVIVPIGDGLWVAVQE